MTGLFSKLNFILWFCCINEKNIWKFCGFMTHQKCVKSMVGETWIELFCTHCHFGKCCDCGELWEKSAYYFHMLQPLPKWFSSPYSTFSGPFKEQFLFFCFCVWIRPSHCGQTDKQYNWTVTRSAVAFERVKTIYFLLWVMAFERVKKRTTLFFGLNDCLWKCQIREPFQLPLSAMSLERVISNILFTRLFTWSLSKQSL